MLLSLASNAFSFSLIETIKTNKLKITRKICRMIAIEPNIFNKKDNIIIIKVDLKKTAYLKTAIIENECTTRLKKDIFEGPKYLRPLIESASFRLVRFFFIEPERLLHKLALSERILTSFLVKQL
tara:strand:+ start:233 stop:607 length:375 start_codon:yes stop_codon:yes gene_type:complete